MFSWTLNFFILISRKNFSWDSATHFSLPTVCCRKGDLHQTSCQLFIFSRVFDAWTQFESSISLWGFPCIFAIFHNQLLRLDIRSERGVFLKFHVSFVHLCVLTYTYYTVYHMSMVHIIFDNIRYYVHFSVHGMRTYAVPRKSVVDWSQIRIPHVKSSEPEPVLRQHAVRWCTEEGP
jgi:hypothetical protein